MNKLVLMPLVCALWLGVVGSADAQVVHTTFYQPMTVYSAPVAVATPAPVVTFRPAPTVAFQPTTVVAASPVIAPAPVVATTPVVTWQPTAVTETRRRPILGGTVSRTRIQNMPVVVNSPIVLAY